MAKLGDANFGLYEASVKGCPSQHVRPVCFSAFQGVWLRGGGNRGFSRAGVFRTIEAVVAPTTISDANCSDLFSIQEHILVNSKHQLLYLDRPASNFLEDFGQVATALLSLDTRLKYFLLNHGGGGMQVMLDKRPLCVEYLRAVCAWLQQTACAFLDQVGTEPLSSSRLDAAPLLGTALSDLILDVIDLLGDSAALSTHLVHSTILDPDGGFFATDFWRPHAYCRGELCLHAGSPRCAADLHS